MNLYTKFKFRKYWIINSIEKTIGIYNLNESGYYVVTTIIDSYDTEIAPSLKYKLFTNLIVSLDFLFNY